MPFADYQLRFSPSHVAGSHLWSAGPFLQTLTRIATLPRADVGIVHCHLSHKGSFVREGGIALAARRRGLPTVITLHSVALAEFQQNHPHIVATVLRQADVIIVLGEATLAMLAPALRARTVVVPNAATVPLTPPPAADGGNSQTVLFAGEVSRAKGVDTLVAAWPLVREMAPEARLEIAGPPGDFEPVPLPGIDWLGPLPREEVLRRSAGCRVATLPSCFEGMPMFLLEAMGAGRPVVATPVGEVPDLVADTGLLVEVGDVAGLAAALGRLLTEPDTATRLGELARERVSARHSVAVVAAQLAAVYDRVRHSDAGRAAPVADQATAAGSVGP